MSTCLSTCLSTCVSTCLSTYLQTYQPNNLPTSLERPQLPRYEGLVGQCNTDLCGVTTQALVIRHTLLLVGAELAGVGAAGVEKEAVQSNAGLLWVGNLCKVILLLFFKRLADRQQNRLQIAKIPLKGLNNIQ